MKGAQYSTINTRGHISDMDKTLPYIYNIKLLTTWLLTMGKKYAAHFIYEVYMFKTNEVF